MAFVKVNKSATGAHQDTGPMVRMGSSLQSEKQSSRAVYFSITRTAIDEVGWSLEAEGDRRVVVSVGIHEGTGSDAGFLLLTHEESGYRLGSTRKRETSSSFAMNVSVTRFRHYVINDPLIEKDTAPVEFTIDAKDHTILIQCPEWLRYNPLTAPQPEIEERPQVVEERKPARPTRTIVQETVDDIDVVTRKPDKMVLNREERRRLAKKVVSQLGR